jgi:hypothetical protein
VSDLLGHRATFESRLEIELSNITDAVLLVFRLCLRVSERMFYNAACGSSTAKSPAVVR